MYMILVFAMMMDAQIARPQQAFCQFVAAYNRQQFNETYDALNPGFQAQVDRAVCTGGLQHVYATNGAVLSASIERQSFDEGWYFVLAERGVFKAMLSVDSLGRIDGLRIKQVEADAPMPVAKLFFRETP